jgi:uncharacterized protein YdeI (YjbR/CyaY-like superfamily)
MEPVFFATPDEFRAWLEQHHGSEPELLVGFYKKGTGLPSMTWSDAVDQALCFGWIDGQSKSIDELSYRIRFTPRRRGSIWSKVNIAKVARLSEQGLMRPAGVAAFEQRREDRSGVYSFERDDEARLEPDQEERFRANEAAWEFFQRQPPWYRRTAIHLVVSAKRPETRERRLATLIEDSAAGRTLKQLTRPGRNSSQPPGERP